MKWPVLLLFATLCQGTTAGETPPATDFLRVQRDTKTIRLQPAVTTYFKEGVSVTLLGAVHLADRCYFDDLAIRFSKFDRLLFEMIGGENLIRTKKKTTPTDDLLARDSATMATFLELTEQKSAVDYSAKNFVHADLTLAEFEKRKKDRGETLANFTRTLVDREGTEKEALMSALLSGDAERAKLLMMVSLAKTDEAMGDLSDGSVVITDRNARCFNVLDGEIANGHRKLGIFYGAGHFPAMEKELLARGFRMTAQEWLSAWSVPAS